MLQLTELICMITKDQYYTLRDAFTMLCIVMIQYSIVIHPVHVTSLIFQLTVWVADKFACLY